jgi:metal-responsive CopG/Arc/MetJ family transcriptional regulator
MADSKAVSIRIPDELLAKIDDLAERKYKSIKGKPNRSLVILDAVVAFFNAVSDSEIDNNLIALSDTVDIKDFKKLQDFVAALSEDVTQLKSALITPSDTAIKAENIEPEQEIAKISADTQLSVLGIEEGFTVSMLAERFQIKPNDITSRKFKNKANPGLFVSWSKEKDPDGQSWEFRKDSKLFYQVTEAASSIEN